LEEEKENAEKSHNQGDIDSMQEIATRIRRKEAKGAIHSPVREH